MGILNLTPHKLTIFVGNQTITIEPSGYVARVQVETVEVGVLRVGEAEVPVVRDKLGKVVVVDSLSERELTWEQFLDKVPKIVAIITSRMTAEAIKGTQEHRRVFVPDTSPGSVVRGGNGKIVGVKRLVEIV